MLLAPYSLGLGDPLRDDGDLVPTDAGFCRLAARHAQRIEQVAGVVVVAVGVLFGTGAWRTFFVPLQRAFAKFGWPPI